MPDINQQMIAQMLMQQGQPQTQGGMAPQMGGGQQALQGIAPLLQMLMYKKMMQQQKPPGLLSPQQPDITQAINANIPGQSMPPMSGPQQ